MKETNVHSTRSAFIGPAVLLVLGAAVGFFQIPKIPAEFITDPNICAVGLILLFVAGALEAAILAISRKRARKVEWPSLGFSTNLICAYVSGAAVIVAIVFVNPVAPKAAIIFGSFCFGGGMLSYFLTKEGG